MPFPTPLRIAQSSSRHPRRVLLGWAALLLVAFVAIGAFLSSATTTDILFRGQPEAVHGRAVLKDRLGVTDNAVETVVVQTPTAPVATPQVRAAVAAAATRIRALGPEKVVNVTTAFDAGAPPTMISRDGRTALMSVRMAGDVNEGERNIPPVMDLVAGLDRSPVLTARIAGPASARFTNSHQAERDLSRGEMMIGLPVAMLILLLVFRAVGAMVLPLAVAAASIIGALGVTAVAGQISQLSFFVTNMITMMGLAVGIDYALFIVSRYREERAAGLPVREAVDRASATSGRAVGFSGIAVVVALVGLLIVPTSIFGSLALGAIFVVAAAVLASMTLLPALLAVMGDRVEWGSLPRRRSAVDAQAGLFDRIAKAVMCRPIVTAVLSAGLLLVAASPYLDVRTGANGVESLPPSTGTRQAFDILKSDFGAGSGGPVIVTLEGDLAGANDTVPQRIADAMGDIPGLGAATVTTVPARQAAMVSAPMNIAPASPEARAVVDRLRDTVLPQAVAGTGLRASVTGETAFNTDFFNITDRYLPIVVPMVLVLSFLVLLVAFRSVVVPLVAILMNLLSVGAAYGLLVLVFQKGVGVDLLGLQQVAVIEAWLPLFLFAVLFGLSMDYHVFLLSRIRERYDATGDTPGAIRHGVSSSARLITGAALIMVAVFGGFAMGELVMFQQMGFGLGVAILLDATIIRTFLVPAVMRLLGDRNWYLPRMLRFVPQVSTEG